MQRLPRLCLLLLIVTAQNAFRLSVDRFVSLSSNLFAPEVVEPVRLHVAAKRYLCAADQAYRAAFEVSPHFAAAVQLRHYDDLAKTPGAWTPGLTHYRPYLEAGLHS